MTQIQVFYGGGGLCYSPLVPRTRFFRWGALQAAMKILCVSFHGGKDWPNKPSKMNEKKFVRSKVKLKNHIVLISR